MDTQDRKLLFSYFIRAALISFVVFFLSFFTIPRSDQVVYLANTAHETGWVSLAIGNYSWNREIWAYNPFPGEFLLFRPLLFILLGTEQWLFGHNFMYWQITAFASHLLVLWCLLKVLLQISKSPFAFYFTAFFSVLSAGIEMVTWHHISGLMLFIACILEAYYQLQSLIIKSSICPQVLTKVMVLLLLASFFYEIGCVYAVVFAVYFCFMFRSKDAHGNLGNKLRIFFFLCLPFFLYVGFNFFDLYARDKMMVLWAGDSSITPFRSLVRLPLNAILVFVWFICAGLFPFWSSFYLAGRTQVVPFIAEIEFSLLQRMILLAAMVCLLGILMHREKVVMFLKDRGRFLLLPFLLILFYVFFLCLGRIDQKGVAHYLGINSYCNYYFWVFFIIVVYEVFSFFVLRMTEKDHKVRLGVLFVMTFLIAINSCVTIAALTRRIASEAFVRAVDQSIKVCILEHGREKDFSFWVEEGIKSMIEYDWVRKEGDPPGKNYTYAELVYLKYYKQRDPKYLLGLDKQGDLKWQRM